MPESAESEQTQDRLLRAAVEVFAERGFRDATVREICTRALVNVASVNYYFRSKQALYLEALNHAFRQADQRYPLGNALDRKLTPEVRLTHFISIFLSRLLDDSCLGHHGKLIAREIANPTKALDEIIRTAIAPHFRVLEEIVTQLLGASRSRGEVHRCVLSILGQCLMFKHSRSVIERVCPEVIATAEEVQRSAQHIAQFSLAALKQMAVPSEGAET